MELQLPETEELGHLGCVTSMLPKISTPVGQGIVAFADKANGKAGRVSPSPNSPRLSTSRRQLCPDIEASLVMTSGKVGMPKPASPSSVGLKLPAPNSKPADPTASKVGYSLAGTGNNFFEGDTNNVLGVNKLSLLRETSSLVEVSIPADDAEELDVLEEFNACLDSLEAIEVDDLAAKGFWYTWLNKRGGEGDNKSKLDRVLVHTSWLDTFREAEAVFHFPGVSAHCAAVKSWEEMQEYPMLRLINKLRHLKPVLIAFNKQRYGNISGRVTQARLELEAIQEQCFNHPGDGASQELERDLLCKLLNLSTAEESYKKLKSRVKWLSWGDKNTVFSSEA
ncbi:hypothetical protein Vadar_006119 [Vaccinium darrowii]|uniref:Uncharacterized protein n=1 Tax=Vaccinium darrowii TaxID=229202 RepID=A0ACB7X7X0_9ERIC|nr:hypothetical protein Vadar_006119 [Vaccinium darrowii]